MTILALLILGVMAAAVGICGLAFLASLGNLLLVRS